MPINIIPMDLRNLFYAKDRENPSNYVRAITALFAHVQVDQEVLGINHHIVLIPKANLSKWDAAFLQKVLDHQLTRIQIGDDEIHKVTLDTLGTISSGPYRRFEFDSTPKKETKDAL